MNRVTHTLYQLLRETPRPILKMAREIDIIRTTSIKHGWLGQAIFKKQEMVRKTIHQCSIHRIDGDFTGLNSPVKVSCDCDFFLYVCEYALHAHGNADIIYSNGNPPHKTNPECIPILCIAEGSLIETQRGLVPIERVFEGDRVLTLDGYQRVTVAKNTGMRSVVEIRTKDDYILRATLEHPVYSVKDGRAQWVALRDLDIGDDILVYTKNTALTVWDWLKNPKKAWHDRKHCMGQFYFDTISYMQFYDYMPIYDLTIDHSGHYVASGVLVHNCKHLAAFTSHLKMTGRLGGK